MSEGRQFVNIMFETDKGAPFSIDICYTERSFSHFPGKNEMVRKDY